MIYCHRKRTPPPPKLWKHFTSARESLFHHQVHGQIFVVFFEKYPIQYLIKDDRIHDDKILIRIALINNLSVEAFWFLALHCPKVSYIFTPISSTPLTLPFVEGFVFSRYLVKKIIFYWKVKIQPIFYTKTQLERYFFFSFYLFGFQPKNKVLFQKIYPTVTRSLKGS